jgi:hypothetical protein
VRAPHVRFPRDQRKGTEKCCKVEAHVPAQSGQELSCRFAMSWKALNG